MDRTIQPEIQTLKNFRILPPVRMTLPNGIPLTVINAGEQEVVRIDVLLPGVLATVAETASSVYEPDVARRHEKNIRLPPLPRNWITTAHGSNCPARRNMHISLFIR